MSNKSALSGGFAGVITGASSGIGRALAVLLAQRLSARLVLNARSKEPLEECADLVRKAGGQAQVVAGSVSDGEVVALCIKSCLNKFGQIDLIVNNAGLAHPGPVTSLTFADWQRVFDVNFFGALRATYEALPHFIKQGRGKVVNVSSVAGKVAFPGSVCYAASKFAMTAMSEGMAAELSRHNIDVITVCPGWVRTNFFKANQVSDWKSPTMIAEKKDFSGWLMRHCLSISSEEAAEEIFRACQRGGSRELILTAPGVIIDKLNRYSPAVLSNLIRRIPLER